MQLRQGNGWSEWFNSLASKVFAKPLFSRRKPTLRFGITIAEEAVPLLAFNVAIHLRPSEMFFWSSTNDVSFRIQGIFTEFPCRWAFADPAQFCRAFRQAYGISPEAFRASQSGNWAFRGSRCQADIRLTTRSRLAGSRPGKGE